MNSTFIKFIDPSIFVITIGHWEIKYEGQMLDINIQMVYWLLYLLMSGNAGA